MVNRTAITLIIALFLWFSSCTFQNEETYFEDTICDTTNLTYSDIRPIFTDNCMSCHNSTFTQREGIELDTYENTVNSINTGLVLPAIKHEGDFNMPANQPQLPDCLILKIETWVNNQMPEN